MAVTYQAEPQTYCPAFNPQWFVATSNQTGQPNFRYTVVLTDVLSGESVTKDIDPDPNGYCKLDAGGFSEQYVTQVCPYGLYGFQTNTGAVREIRVNIGETYGTNPTYYANSITKVFYVWNGAIDWLDFQSVNYLDYVYTHGNNIQLVTNNHNPDYSWDTSPDQVFYSNAETVTEDRDTFLYFLSPTSNAVEKIRIIGYDSSGSVMGSTVIGNASSGTTSYQLLYQFINVGYRGLENMPSWQIVSGTSPIPVSTYDYWEVYDESSWLPAATPPAADYIYPLKRFNMVCEERYDVVTVHYLAPEGSFETQPCVKLSLRKSDVDRKFYSKLPYRYSGYNVVYDYSSAIENTLSSNIKNKITVNTDWLTEAEVTQLKDAISSPVIYVDLGDAEGVIAMKMMTNSYEEKKKYNSQLLSVSFDLEYAHQNVRQKG
jgi:hypothetical protein